MPLFIFDVTRGFKIKEIFVVFNFQIINDVASYKKISKKIIILDAKK